MRFLRTTTGVSNKIKDHQVYNWLVNNSATENDNLIGLTLSQLQGGKSSMIILNRRDDLSSNLTVDVLVELFLELRFPENIFVGDVFFNIEPMVYRGNAQLVRSEDILNDVRHSGNVGNKAVAPYELNYPIGSMKLMEAVDLYIKAEDEPIAVTDAVGRVHHSTIELVPILGIEVVPEIKGRSDSLVETEWRIKNHTGSPIDVYWYFASSQSYRLSGETNSARAEVLHVDQDIVLQMNASLVPPSVADTTADGFIYCGVNTIDNDFTSFYAGGRYINI